jgi:hypothetical protein
MIGALKMMGIRPFLKNLVGGDLKMGISGLIDTWRT